MELKTFFASERLAEVNGFLKVGSLVFSESWGGIFLVVFLGK